MSLTCETFDGPQAIRSIQRKARKVHSCCECGKDITIGEKYVYTSGIWDGTPHSFHACEKCEDLRESMTELGFCITYERLLSEHAEYVDEQREWVKG